MTALSEATIGSDSKQGSRGQWLEFAVVSLGTMLTFLNITGTVSVLSPIVASAHASGVDLVWISSIYSMAVGSLVLSAGTLGDIIGRRRVFAIGAFILGAASLAAFFANSPGQIIVTQAVMGIGGAMILPNGLALIINAFTDAHERTAAMSLWIAVSGLGFAAGPIIAGALLTGFSWHSVYLVNACIAGLVLLLIPLWVTESKHPSRRLDPAGLILAVLSLVALNYAVVQGGADGYGSTQVIVSWIVAVVAGIAFLFAESHVKNPMLHLHLFRNASFSTANVVGLVAQYTVVGIAIGEVLYFEQVRHDSIIDTGLQLLSIFGAYVIASSVAARIVRRIGFKVTITAGLVLVVIGVAITLWQQPDTATGITATALALTGFGAGIVLPSATATAVVSVPQLESGMAGATVNMFRQIGSTLGASLTGTIITSGLASRLPGQLTQRGVPAPAARTIAEAVSSGAAPASPPSPSLARIIDDAAGNAFVDSLHLAGTVAGVAALVTAVLAAFFIHHRPAPSKAAESPAPAAKSAAV